MTIRSLKFHLALTAGVASSFVGAGAADESYELVTGTWAFNFDHDTIVN